MAARRAPVGRGRVALAALLAGSVLLFAGTGHSQGIPLVAGLSKDLVAITTGFAGTDVLLFGATEGRGDVVVIVRGPERPVVMHRKSRVLGIWVNTAKMTFQRAPAYYTVASSRPLEEVAPEPVLARHQMGIEQLRLELPRAKASPNVAAEWRAGLIRNHVALGLYREGVGSIVFLGNRLFRTQLHFPANVPTGIYQVQVYLVQDGHVISAQTSALHVNKIGTEAEVYDFAFRHSALYGLIAILVALMAGWFAHLVFRKA